MPLLNFEKFCYFILLYKKFFITLRPNSDLSSIWGCSELHRSRDVKPWLPYLLGARKQKTVPSVEQAGANPARHIVAKAKEGLPSYAESNESVYWRLWFDVLKRRKFHNIVRMQDEVDAHGCIKHSCMPHSWGVHAYDLHAWVSACLFDDMGFLRPQNTDNISYPRFFVCIFTNFLSIWNRKSSFL